MSINIAKNIKTNLNSMSLKTSQPRDEKGRFVRPTVHEEVNSIVYSEPISGERVKTCASFIWNFMNDNGVVRRDTDNIKKVIYLHKGDDSFYLFIRNRNSYGFRMNCGNLEEVLNDKAVKELLNLPMSNWDEIQKA